jgi:flagellar protein FliS
MRLANAALAYRETTALGATPVGMVVLLYDRLLQDTHNAVIALETQDVEARARHVNHALLILQQLQGTLDFGAGEATARQLDAFYRVVRGKLLEAQIRQSPELMLQQARAIAEVREAWAKLDSSVAIAGASTAAGQAL